MCGLITPLLLGGSAIAKTIGQNQQAKAQEKMYRSNAVAAGKAAVAEAEAQGIEADRQMQQLQGQSLVLALEAVKNQASIAASAAESGVSGISVDIEQQSVTAATERAQGGIREDMEAIRLNNRLAADSIKATQEARINSVQRGQKGNLFGNLLNAGMEYGMNRLTQSSQKTTLKDLKIKPNE